MSQRRPRTPDARRLRLTLAFALATTICAALTPATRAFAQTAPPPPPPCAAAPPAASPSPSQNAARANLSVSYNVRMSRPTTHLFEVSMTIEHVSTREVDVQFPVWVPGAYTVVDAARNVQELRASTTAGQPLMATKLDTKTWRIETGAASALRVEFKVYADNPAVPGMHLDDTHAFFNGALMFPYVVGAKDRPVQLHLDRPPRWNVVSTGLDPLAGEPDTFAAPDYDTLIDAPFEVGTHQVMRFDYAGARYEIAVYGNHNYDAQRFRTEVERIVRSQVDMMCGAPFARYVFIFHMLPEGRGGLEHLNSTVINRRKYAGATEEGWDSLRGVTSHEFFHLWNVKRLRPFVLGPFDYAQQVVTRDLYVSEGMTSYYGNLHLARSRLWTPERYYKQLAGEIQTLQSRPARRFLSVEESSINTWLKPDDEANSSISYYNKGELLGLILDMEIRARTRNTRSLDDVFQYLFDNYGLSPLGYYATKTGWTPGGFERAVETVSGSDFTEFFRRYVSGGTGKTPEDELPYERALGYAGLRLERKETGTPDLGLTFSTEPQPHGAVGVALTGVSSESPAYNVLAPNDVLLAVDGERATQATLPLQLARFREGERVPLTIFRGDRLLEVSFTFQARPAISYAINEDPRATPEQKALRDSWLTGRGTASVESLDPEGVRLAAEVNGQVCEVLSDREANALDARPSPEFRSPYTPGEKARVIVLQKEVTFARAHVESNRVGAWLMRPEAGERLGWSAVKIKDRFALECLPTHVSEVVVPKGTRLRVGRVAPQTGWGTGGEFQYELLTFLPPAAYRKTRPLR